MGKALVAGLLIGVLGTSAYFVWREYQCMDFAMSPDSLEITQREAAMKFAVCYSGGMFQALRKELMPHRK